MPDSAQPKATLQIADLRKNAQPIKVPVDGILGHCYWSRDGRELVVSMLSLVKEERTFQKSPPVFSPDSQSLVC